jgi:hypothetical protein
MTVLKSIDRWSIAESRRNVLAMNCHDSRRRRFLFRMVCARSTYAIRRMPAYLIVLCNRVAKLVTFIQPSLFVQLRGRRFAHC